MTRVRQDRTPLSTPFPCSISCGKQGPQFKFFARSLGKATEFHENCDEERALVPPSHVTLSIDARVTMSVNFGTMNQSQRNATLLGSLHRTKTGIHRDARADGRVTNSKGRGRAPHRRLRGVLSLCQENE